MSRGSKNEYLGMNIEYDDGKVVFYMTDYMDDVILDAPEDMQGTVVTPASNNLFTTRDDSDTLDEDQA